MYVAKNLSTFPVISMKEYQTTSEPLGKQEIGRNK